MRFSLSYQLVKQGVKVCKEVFYRKHSVVGLENIPKDKPYILAPNHQNAFMDPVMAAINLRWTQTFYLVRADIFKKKLASKILHSLNMMPIYRIRDGADSMEKNNEIFEKCYAYLKGGNPIMIFPEGNHNNQKKLRAVKKGIGRIAFGAEELYDFKLDVQIVPVGLNYSNHTDVGATLQVAFGKPISILDYKEAYLSEPSKALLDVREKVHKGISELIINIQSEHYDFIENVRKIYELELSEYTFDLDTEIKNSQQFIAAFEETKLSESKTDELSELANQIRKESKRLKIKLFALSEKKYNLGFLVLQSLLLLVLFPSFLFGLINNYFPFHLPRWIVQKLIKDLHFHSSLKMGFGLVLFPLFYIIQTSAVFAITDNSLIALSYLIVCFLSGIIALKWFYKWREVTQKLKVNRLFNTKKYQDLITKKEVLKESVSSFYSLTNDV